MPSFQTLVDGELPSMEARKIVIISSDGKILNGRPVQPAQITYPTHIPKGNKLFLPDCHDYTERGESDDEMSPHNPKKRARLVHLTDNEKNLRRKMKNREAAQTARDRKKCYVESLEHKVKILEADKVTLQQAKQFVEGECMKLKDDNESLQRENQQLKQLLLQLQNREIVLDNDDTQLTSEVVKTENVVYDANVQEQDCLVPIDSIDELGSGVTVGGNKSAALKASPQQSHLLQALVTMVTMLLLSTKCPSMSGESTTLLAHVLKTTQKRKRYVPTKLNSMMLLQDQSYFSQLQHRNLFRKPP